MLGCGFWCKQWFIDSIYNDNSFEGTLKQMNYTEACIHSKILRVRIYDAKLKFNRICITTLEQCALENLNVNDSKRFEVLT